MATKSLDDGMTNLSLKDSYIISTAIDFGTTFSGYAFSFRTSPNDIKMNKNWGAELGCDSYKAPTCVMTNPDGSFHSFGYKAEHEYNQLDPDDDKIGGPNGYNLYRHFKMLLHNQDVNLSSTVVSTSGHIRPAIDIFVMVLQHLKKHMMDPIQKALKSPPEVSDIRWVLTVPAIWNDESKGFMREAVYRSGLISEKNSSNLLIALEPEATSIFCRSLQVNTFTSDEGNSSDGLTFCSGEKLLIIDAGGGTVDITAHEILTEGQVKEISPPSGGPWGGIKVDGKFVSTLAKMFGSNFINKFKTKRPQQWLQFMTNFEKSKKALVPDGKCSIKIPVPYSFEKDIMKMMQLELEEFVKQSKVKGIRFSNGYIVVKHEMAKGLFSECITNIVDHVMKLLSDKTLGEINYILLVGGFAECKILQDACQSMFSDKVKVLIPVEAQVAIMKGAVLFGHNPLHIVSRIARYTYGIAVEPYFEEGMHDPAKRFVNIDGKVMCNDVFHTLIKKGDIVHSGAARIQYFPRSSKTNALVSFEIFKADKAVVKYVDESGVHKLGVASLHNVMTDCVETKITFGHTELRVEAREKGARGDCYPLSITVDFISD